MNSRDRIERDHADATHGYRYDDDHPSWREAREDMRPRPGDPVATAEDRAATAELLDRLEAERQQVNARRALIEAGWKASRV